MDLVPNHTSDQHAWFVDALSGRDVGAPRLLRLGRPQARRQPAQQLGEHLRRAGLGARRGQRAVLPAQLRGGAARPELVERGRPPRVRRHRALLVGPRRGRVPHRRVQHDDQGQGAARQPARHRGRPARPAVHGPARRLQHRPARGARHPAALARHRRRATSPSASSSARPTSRSCPSSWSSTATGTTSCTAASTSCSSTRRSRPPRCARSSRTPRRCCPRGRGPSGRRPTTTSRVWPPAGRPATRPRSRWRC